MLDFIQYFIIASCICPTKCGPRGNKTLIRFVTDYLRKYIGLISLIKGEAVDQSHRYESHESHVKKIAKVNRDIQLCNPFSQNSNSFPWISNSFPRIRQSVFSDCISFLRIAIVEIEGTNCNPRERLSKSRKQFTIRENGLYNSKERIAQFDITIYRCYCF